MCDLQASWKAANEKKREKTSVTLDVTRSREVTEWQQRMGTVRGRDLYILKDGTWSDLTVTVGEYGTENGVQVFQAHRLQVAKTSSVLASMVYFEDNLFDEQTCIYLPDLTPKVFSSLLDFMYGIKPILHSIAHAKALLKATVKYQLPISMKRCCQEYIKENGVLNVAVELEENDSTIKERSWQMGTLFMFERDKYMLDTEKWVDCTFRVGKGDNSKVFCAHRLVLAKTSPVFATMLFGHWAKLVEIKITDVTVEAFTTFLSYAYEGRLYVAKEEFMNSGTIWDFLYLAKKYLLPDRLLEQCRAWIFADIYSNNFWAHFQQSHLHGEDKLYNVCEQILQRFTSFCLTLPASLDVDMWVVMWLVQCESLECREIFLFQYCVNWVKARLISQGKLCSPENIVTFLGDIVLHIRFTTMTLEEFTEGPAKMKLFTEEQILNIQDCARNFKKIWFTRPHQRDRKLKRRESIYLYGCCREDVNFLGMKTKNNTYSALLSSKNLFYTIESAELNWISEITIPTQKKPAKCTSDSYDEDASVYAYDRNSGELLGIARFSGQVHYDKNITLEFHRPVHSHSEDAVLTFVPHKSGTYPSKESYKYSTKIEEINGRNVRISEITIKSQYIDPQKCDVPIKLRENLMLNCWQCVRCEKRIARRKLHSWCPSIDICSLTFEPDCMMPTADFQRLMSG